MALYLIANIPRDGGPGSASIHDCVDAPYAARTYGVDDADVYVVEMSVVTTAYRRSRAVSLDTIPPAIRPASR